MAASLMWLVSLAVQEFATFLQTFERDGEAIAAANAAELAKMEKVSEEKVHTQSTHKHTHLHAQHAHALKRRGKGRWAHMA